MKPSTYPFIHVRSSLTLEILRKYPNPVFVETGTNVGHAVSLALECGFPVIHSIEEDHVLFAGAVTRFKDRHNVVLHYGDSASVLARYIIPALTTPTTFYLDAHSTTRNPLLSELAAISASLIEGHTILIDDVRMFGSADWHGLKLEDALRYLHRIDPDFEIDYEDTVNAKNDLLVARRSEWR